MKGQRVNLFIYFVGMAVASGVLFFMAAALAEPFKKLVLLLNDPQVQKTTKDWLTFLAMAIPIGFLWGGFWLMFKGCEKKFLEVWLAKPQPKGTSAAQ